MKSVDFKSVIFWYDKYSGFIVYIPAPDQESDISQKKPWFILMGNGRDCILLPPVIFNHVVLLFAMDLRLN